MMGVIMRDIEKGNEKAKHDAEAKEHLGMLQIQVLFNRMLQRKTVWCDWRF